VKVDIPDPVFDVIVRVKYTDSPSGVEYFEADVTCGDVVLFTERYHNDYDKYREYLKNPKLVNRYAANEDDARDKALAALGEKLKATFAAADTLRVIG
jgi:hypothetical protein